LGGLDLIGLVQERVWWPAAVKVVMRIRVP